MMAPRHTNELKIPEKVLTLCSKSGPIEKGFVRSMIRQVIWEIPVENKGQRGVVSLKETCGKVCFAYYSNQQQRRRGVQ